MFKTVRALQQCESASVAMPRAQHGDSAPPGVVRCNCTTFVAIAKLLQLYTIYFSSFAIFLSTEYCKRKARSATVISPTCHVTAAGGRQSACVTFARPWCQQRRSPAARERPAQQQQLLPVLLLKLVVASCCCWSARAVVDLASEDAPRAATRRGASSDAGAKPPEPPPKLVPRPRRPRPNFSWDTIPLAFRGANRSGLYNEATVRILAKYQLVTIEKWYTACGSLHPIQAGPECDVEKAMYHTFNQIKAINPNITNILYLNSMFDFRWAVPGCPCTSCI